MRRRLAQALLLLAALAAAGLVLRQTGFFRKPPPALHARAAVPPPAAILTPAAVRALLNRWTFPGAAVIRDGPTARTVFVRGRPAQVWRFYALRTGMIMARRLPYPPRPGAWSDGGPGWIGAANISRTDGGCHSLFVRRQPPSTVRVLVNQPVVSAHGTSTVFLSVGP